MLLQFSQEVRAPILVLDQENLEVKYASLNFTLLDDSSDTKHIQYVSGAATVKSQGNLLLTWGSMDREAYLSTFSLESVLAFTVEHGEISSLGPPEVID